MFRLGRVLDLYTKHGGVKEMQLKLMILKQLMGVK
jgi:hypothetical protein